MGYNRFSFYCWVCVVKKGLQRQSVVKCKGKEKKKDVWHWCRRPACRRESRAGRQRGCWGLMVLGGWGADRGDETREALWKCHCHFDSWIVFKKRRCWPFPPLCRDKEPGRQQGELGPGPAPRGMFPLNKQLWTMSTFCPPSHSLIPPHSLYKVWKMHSKNEGSFWNSHLSGKESVKALNELELFAPPFMWREWTVWYLLPKLTVSKYE